MAAAATDRERGCRLSWRPLNAGKYSFCFLRFRLNDGGGEGTVKLDQHNSR